MLPKGERIARNSEIKAIKAKRQLYYSSPLLSLYAIDNQLPSSRIKVVCSKRLGGSVVRNRVRRLIIAALLKIRRNINKNIDILVYPRQAGLLWHECLLDLSKGLLGAS